MKNVNGFKTIAESFPTTLASVGATLIYLGNFLHRGSETIIIVIGAPILFYTIVSETLLMGQTLGKKLVKIRVVKIDGYRASFLDYFIRWVMRFVDINIFSGVPYPAILENLASRPTILL